jgi:hypothetical protein
MGDSENHHLPPLELSVTKATRLYIRCFNPPSQIHSIAATSTPTEEPTNLLSTYIKVSTVAA